MKTLTLSLALVGISAYAQTIESIRYDGMIHISEAMAKQLTTCHVGDTIDPASIDKTVKNFYAQGYFEDIWVENIDGNVTFHVREKPVISKVELKGYKENDEEARKSLLQIEKGDLYDPKQLQMAKQRLIDALAHDGKIDSVVEIESDKLDNGTMSVRFVVNEGSTIIIKNVTYNGVKAVEPSAFEKMIANRQEQTFGWFWGRSDGKLKTSDLEYDPYRIRDYYWQNGYLDVNVEDPFVQVDFDRYEAQMTYNIHEGEIYRISDIQIHQATNVIEDQALLKAITMTKNTPFNIKTFREDAERIKTQIADLGYAFVQVQPDLRKDPQTQSVVVVYQINPGKKVRIRNVIISGNTRTLDRVVRRELFLSPGDWYNLTNLKDSRNALGRTGYFGSTTIEEKRIDDETMDLVVQVKETSTGSIQVGGGYGSYTGVLASVAVSDRDIFGSGITTGIHLERSLRTENYSFNISNPRLNDSDFSGNFSIFQTAAEYSAYTIHSTGTSFSVGHRFTRYVTGSLGYGYSQNHYTNFNTDYLVMSQEYYQDYAKSSVSASISFDNTDDYYVPREGIAFLQSIERAGLGGEADFLKLRTNFGFYQGLQSWVGSDVIFRYKGRMTYVDDTGFLPLAEKVYLGGVGSIRGYQSYSISPTYGVDSNGVSYKTGGTRSLSNSLELSFPLVPEARMRLAAFVDYGWIGQNRLDEVSRGGYGMALEWYSPMGPLQLVFARPIHSEAGDHTSYFEFTIGQRF